MSDQSRRDFLAASAAVGAAGFIAPAGFGAWVAMHAIGWPGAGAIAIIYPLVLWLVGGIGDDERALLRRILGRVG